jgi:hypothetical protein
MPEQVEYAVRITCRGTASEPFGWTIVCNADGHEAAQSSRTFPTRAEALADSARAAATFAVERNLVKPTAVSYR